VSRRVGRGCAGFGAASVHPRSCKHLSTNYLRFDMILSTKVTSTSQNTFVPMNSSMFHIFSKHIASKGNNSNSSKREVQDQYTTAYKQAKDQGINLSKH